MNPVKQLSIWSTLAAYAVFHGDVPALAQKAQGAAGAAPPESQLPVRRFDIPAGALDRVLDAYRVASGVKVLIPFGPEVLRGIQSPGASGFLTDEQALRDLLLGTSLTYRFDGRRSVTVRFESAESISVAAAAPSPLAQTMPKYSEPLRDTPQSIDVVGTEVMQQQATTTLRDALRNVAGISIAAGEGGAQGDNLTIRGFSSRNDIFIDGMRDFGSYYRDPFALDEVEVLRGPSSVTFGRGSTGGVVNQATKTAQTESFVDGTVTDGTDQTHRVTADVNQPLGAGTSLRINALGHDSHVAGRDIAESRRYGLLGAFATGIDTPTRLDVEYLHQKADDIPDYGIPWLFGRPANVNRENYYGFADGNYLRTDVDVATTKLTHSFDDGMSIRSQLRYAHYSRDVRITEARLPATVTATTPLDAIQVIRGQIAVNSAESFLQSQTDLSKTLMIGDIKHSLMTGIELGRETSDPTRFTYTGVPDTSLLHPDPSQAFAGTAAVSSAVWTTSKSVGVYALDTVTLSPQWELTGGIRFDRFDTNFINRVPTLVAFSRVDQMPTGRTALVYKPLPNGSIYADFSTSFNPSAESLSLSAATADTDPEKNRSYEAGTKWDLAGGRFSLRTALYRIDKLNAREPDPANPLQNVLAGHQRVDGLEVESSGRLNTHWQLLLGYAHMDSRVVDSQFYKTSIGLPLANVPKNTLSLWNNLSLPWQVDLGIGGQYIGSRIASTTAPFDTVTGLLKVAPSYWTANAMLRRPLSKRIDLQLNLTNLTNAYYLDQLHPAHIVPGAGRSVTLGITYRSARGGA